MSRRILPTLIALVLVGVTLPAAVTNPEDASSELESQPGRAPARRWADWIEPDFPFFSSVVDARDAGPGSPANNLTPRGLVLNLGGGLWCCFDLDLLRIAAVWEGSGVSAQSMAAISYQDYSFKAYSGQSKLPQPESALWLANGIYPGWQLGAEPSRNDPREPARSPEEVGRGPLGENHGRFKAVRLTRDGVVLEYCVAGADVRESISAVKRDDRRGIERRIQIGATSEPLVLMLAARPAGPDDGLITSVASSRPAAVERLETGSWSAVRIRRHDGELEFAVVLTRGDQPVTAKLHPETPGSVVSPPRRWPEEITTRATLAPDDTAYVVDDIALPLDNPWRRNLRLTDIQFLRDGTAAVLTFDGDVWMVRGLGGDVDAVRWQRFASGLHEPLSVGIRDEQLFVFDRNGIWRLHDTDGNGEADLHELYSNVFPQTAETREFANTMKLAPDGSFVIAKGGQQFSTLGKANGTVLRVSPDGRSYTMLGYGFRQPFIGVHPRKGLVTASDQEGHYVPTTPLFAVRGGTFHGFLSSLLPKEQYPEPIDEPLTWIPRTVNSSGATQVWLTGARMGPLNDALVHIGYNRPTLLLVRLNERQPRLQAAAMTLTNALKFSPLSGAVNPADGQLYVAGFRIYGSRAKRVSGLARVRYTGQPCVLPRELVAMQEGILLRFDVELASSAALDLSNYAVERWNLRRTSGYGSPHFRLDGSKGQDAMPLGSVYMSKDRRAVFIGVPDMRAGVSQMQITWKLATMDGRSFEDVGHFTPAVLARLSPEAEGFERITVDLVPKSPVIARENRAPTIDEGRTLYQTIGCMACHALEGKAQFGPSWRGLFGRKRTLKDGSTVLADEAYLRESITDPAAKSVPGFEAEMPTYAGLLNENQIESLVMYIKTLQ